MVYISEPFILDTDDSAAKYMTGIKGWVSRHGNFFGDGPRGEEIARYHGCTHRRCQKCGEPAPKGYTACDSCRDKAEVERHAKMERRPWDGEALIYSQAADEWFHDLEEVLDHCACHEVTPESMLLVITEPVYADTIDPLEHYVDDLPEESDYGDLPGDIQEAFETLNKAIVSCKVPLSWRPSSYALDCSVFNQQPVQTDVEA